MLSTYQTEKIETLLKEIGQILIKKKKQFKNKGKWIETQFKSEVDLIAEKLLKIGLNQICPLIPILSEEDHK